MPGNLVVGVSDSRFSQAAIAYGMELAKQHGASLVGLGIVDEERLCPPQAVPLGAGAFKTERDEAVLAAAHEKTSKLLADVGERCQSQGIPCRTQKLAGNPAELLVQESQRGDLLLVGKKYMPQEEWESSSQTLYSILHHTARPVLCIPEHAVLVGAALIAFDGSLQSAKTLQLFVASGLAKGRNVHLITVAGDASQVAARGMEFLQSHGIQVSPHLREAHHPADAILHVADELQAGLLVMGAYGQPRIREFIFGSVTKTILRKTKVPLFLYH